MASLGRAALLLVTLLALLSCNPKPANTPLGEETPAPTIVTLSDDTLVESPVAEPEQPVAPPITSAWLPVHAEDTVIGPNDAPITVMWFTDLQCPFCARVAPGVEQLLRQYGDKLRVVIKHNPLPFHKQAYPAALTMASVQEQAGSKAAYEFMLAIYGQKLTAETYTAVLRDQAQQQGVLVGDVLEDKELKSRVDRDMALAKAVGATGTPAFRINGITLSGAQPLAKFQELIDGELREVQQLLKAGGDPGSVYAARVALHKIEPPTPLDRPTPRRDTADLGPWRVPVDKAPTLGPKDALVTIVEFAEFQCPFCKRVQPTLKAIQQKYGQAVRLVFRHNPLPFHPRADPAARLALHIQQTLGNDAFWRAHDLLFESQPQLEDDDLIRVGTQVGLSRAAAKKALTDKRYEQRLQAEQDLAQDLQARGTPHFFVNGIRLSGAQPLERFEELIDEQLKLAQAKVQAGTPRSSVYETILRDAKGPPPPATKGIPKIAAWNPSFGAAGAPVVLYLFSDLQCPFCARLQPTLTELEKKFRGRLRIVWYDMPLPFHQEAEPLANAAHEVRVLGGNKAFWKFIEAVQGALSSPGLGSEASVKALAEKSGVNGDKVVQAMLARKHQAQVEEGKRLAQLAGISGTPASLINGYFLSGAQPLQAFERLVERALKDAKSGKKPDRLE